MPARYRFAAVAAFTLVCTSAFAAKPEQPIVIEGVRVGTEAKYDWSSFYYLPFDVPEGVTGITIQREMKTEPSGNAGLESWIFDPRAGIHFGFRNADFGLGDTSSGVQGPGSGHSSLITYHSAFPNEGFRGFASFGNDPILITGESATTTRRFYCGPIPAGRWYIAQHFRWKSKVTERVRYKYTITFSERTPNAERSTLNAQPSGPSTEHQAPGTLNAERRTMHEGRWYAADFHSHTNHSDGNDSLDGSVALHASQGYDIVTNTDHNITTAQYDLPQVQQKYPNTLILAGEEVSTFNGHANVIGGIPCAWYDPRAIPGDGRLLRLIEKVHHDGGLFSPNHPFAGSGIAWAFPQKDWETADAMEIWNGGWHGSDDRQTVALWDSLLKSGRHITGIGGTDTHAKEGTLTEFTWVWADSLTREAVVDAVRKGHVFISYKKTGPLPYISVPGTSALPGDTVLIGSAESVPVNMRVVGGQGMFLRIVWQDGETKLPLDRVFSRVSFSVPVKTARSYVRLEVQRADGTAFALTNPIWLQRD